MSDRRITLRTDMEQNQTADRKSGSLDAVVRAHDLHGGKWLGAAREWLQWNTLNGDSVTWGSSDVLRPNMTVKMVEELAAHIAAAAINEERERVRSNIKLTDAGTQA